MRIAKFIGKNVHGVLNFNIRFNVDVTFLTGINGSGKTTVVKCIVALMTPSLQALANIDYDIIRIEFRDERERGTEFIEAIKSNGRIEMRASRVDNTFLYQKFIPDSTNPSPRDAEYEQEYYESALSASSANEVLKFIGTIPTPMFLGLDRRARFGDEVERRRYWPSSPPRLSRKGTSVSLTRSLADAAALAETCNRDTLLAVARVGDRLRRTLILELLNMEPRHSGRLQLEPPSPSETRQIDEVDKSLKDLHKVLGVDKSEVEARLNPFLIDLKQVASRISRNRLPAGGKSGERAANSAYMNDLIVWALNNPQLKRIMSMSKILTSYNEEIQTVQTKIVTYLKLVNKFLADSGKQVRFDDHGYIYFSLGRSDDKYYLDTLSSGEAQIFVILTHLAFNPQVKNDNVLIIDEPELSLHVQWQELFVDSIISANPDVQYIMATHAPSIILERTDKCIDISKSAEGCSHA
jgi:predicted ATP-binding protein involved in virulence